MVSFDKSDNTTTTTSQTSRLQTIKDFIFNFKTFWFDLNVLNMYFVFTSAKSELANVYLVKIINHKHHSSWAQ